MTEPLLTERFTAAFALAWEVHGTQWRKNTGIPYMSHLMAVCALALENGADEDIAIAALLHDAVEDCVDGIAMQRRIEVQFGARVGAIVSACSDVVPVPGASKPPWRERKERYLGHLESDADADTLLVSLCDKVHNSGAIAADLRTAGGEVWERFTLKDSASQLWYYSSLAAIFQRRRPGALADRLSRNVSELSELAAAG